jgi:hypothetical protein
MEFGPFAYREYDTYEDLVYTTYNASNVSYWKSISDDPMVNAVYATYN